MRHITILGTEPRHKVDNGPRFPGAAARKASAARMEASGKPAARSAAKATPAARTVDLKAERASAYAHGFRAATLRLATVMASPAVKGREADALKVLSNAAFNHLTATQFVAQFSAATAAKGQSSAKALWDGAHAEIANRRGDAA